MVRDPKLIDKLIADLHFHNYLFVAEGDNIFTDYNENIENLQSALSFLGLGKVLDAHVDFYHGGNVLTKEKSDYINTFIDDVLIDYFFRTYKFNEIIFPKGLCYEQITPNGIVHPNDDISLNLNNIYDRCTFANNIFRLFGIDNDLAHLFSGNKYFHSFALSHRIYGLHSSCGALVNDKHIYTIPLDLFINKYYPGKKLIRTEFRGRTIKEFVNYVYNECEHEYYNSFSSSLHLSLYNFEDGFSKIAKSNIFGDYTIQDILIIYSLLTDKFLLHEDSFLITLCFCMKMDMLENHILNDFIDFEETNKLSQTIEPYIKSKDLYLRFASHTNSKAFSFEQISDTICNVNLFGKHSATLINHSNTLPLPHLYNDIKNNIKSCM